jgi:protein O-mannosyl-transferase
MLKINSPQVLKSGLFILVLWVTFLVYYPGLSGGFIFDDYPYIANNHNIKIQELNLVSLAQGALGANYNPLGRPISMVSFAFTHYFTGLDPFYFKLWNLIIHLINGVGIFFLTKLIFIGLKLRIQPALRSSYIYWVSLTITSLWLLHPLNLTSVLYAAQRMTSLTTVFILSGLILFLWGRINLYEGKKGLLAILLSLGLFTPLATLSKENGILLIYYVLIIEFCIFGLVTVDKPSKNRLLIIYAPIFFSVIAVILFLLLNQEWLTNEYLRRDFTLYERLLTQSRVIFFYLRLILLPDLASLGLFHDDIVTSTGLFSPFSTIISLGGILSLVILAICLYRKAPILSLGLGLFLIGHSMESSIFSLELVHEHRNYFPSYGIALIIVYYIFHPKLKIEYFTLRKIFIGVFILTLSLQTYIRSSYWSNTASYIVINAEHHPKSESAIDSLGQLYADIAINTSDRDERLKYAGLARNNFNKAIELSPSSVSSLLNMLILNSRLGETTQKNTLSILLDRLKNIPVSDNISNQISGLENRCYRFGYCNITNFELRSIFDSILSNSTLIKRSRSNILMAYAQHILLTENDIHKALEFVLAAKQATPKDIYIRISAIKLFIKLNQKENALKLLEDTRRVDFWNLYNEKLKSLSQQVTLLY